MGSVVVSSRSLFNTSYLLNEYTPSKFQDSLDPFGFFDLALVIEAIAFHDRIAVSRFDMEILKEKSRILDALPDVFIQLKPNEHKPVATNKLSPWREYFKDILGFWEPENIKEGTAKQKNASNNKIPLWIRKLEVNLGALEIFSGIFANDLDLSFRPAPVYTGAYRKAFLRQLQPDTGDTIQKAYQAISKAMQLDIDAIKNDGALFPIFIPPVLLFVLQRVRSYYDIPLEIRKIRKKFSETRKYFNEYENHIRDPDISLKKKAKLRNKFQKQLSLLSDSITTHTSNHVAEINGLTDLLSHAAIATGNMGAMNIGGLVKALLDLPFRLVQEYLLKRRIRFLFDFKRQLYTSKDMVGVIERVFQLDLKKCQFYGLKSVD